ncbi:SGNH/GDSL hydrolase family protein [Haloechinothrix sp. YIM 98757]|uniref:SGNH/GDSL hydrolase family protein n=1 Tax=Haloechinothrix aidingensis TaxID=2752311 RepID=A0A838AAS1_9PSEU|nr:diglucosylglycerate octanoyltransferase [Haloechinothrix aidingensis]MBA0126334.1 SGNH/GDSL hydrolase family protein [Haloechinothrix aidingensis]
MTSRRILVLGDSLTFHGPDRAYAADEPRLWPNVAARDVGGTADIVARSGWTARDAWWALISDPRVWADLRRVDAVVLAVGSMDALPSPLPTYLRTGLRYLRPDGLRRATRVAYRSVQPRLAVALRGRPAALPTKLTVRYLDRCTSAMRVLRPGMPILGIVPAPHHAPSYGYVHAVRDATSRAVATWAERAEVPLVDLPGLIGDHVRRGQGNPDGMHWGWDGHEMVGAAVGRLLAREIGVPDPS